MLSNCGTGEDSWESLGLQGDQTSQSSRNSTLNIHRKDWCWTPILWLPDVKGWLIGEDPDAGKDWKQMEKVVQRMKSLDSIIDSMDMNLRKLSGRGAWHAAVHGVTKSWTWLSDRTAKTNVRWYQGKWKWIVCKKTLYNLCNAPINLILFQNNLFLNDMVNYI